MALANSRTTGSANAATVVTIAGVVGQQVRLWAVSAYTTAGSSSLTIEDGSTVIWSSPASAIGAASLYSVAFTRSLDATVNTNMVITASAAGAGNTVTVNVQADVR